MAEKPFILLERSGNGYLLTLTDREGTHLADSIGTALSSLSIDEAGVANLTTPLELHTKDSTFPLPLSRVRIDDAVGVHVQGTLNVDSSYTASPTTFAPKTLTGSATRLTLDDDDFSNGIELPFAFTFYGVTYSTVYVCSNGFISFLGDQPTRFIAESIPARYDILRNPGSPSTVPVASIFGYWVDLLPQDDDGYQGGGTIKYQTFGDTPNRVFVVEYKNVPIYAAFERKVTCQIWLNETTNVIEIHTTKASTDGFDSHGSYTHYATQGIQDAFGTSACHLGGRVRSFFELENDAVIFSPSDGTDGLGLKIDGDPVLSRYQSRCIHLTPSDIEDIGSSNAVTLVPAQPHAIISPVFMSIEGVGTLGTPYTFDSNITLFFVWGGPIEGAEREIPGSDVILIMLSNAGEAQWVPTFSVSNEEHAHNILNLYVNKDLNLTSSSSITGGDLELYITLTYEIIRVHDLSLV